jgi:hypothetical protein
VSTEQLSQYAWLIALAVIWELVWKGLALWRAAKNDSRAWFVALLVLNSVGILPILYLYVFGKRETA